MPLPGGHRFVSCRALGNSPSHQVCSWVEAQDRVEAGKLRDTSPALGAKRPAQQGAQQAISSADATWTLSPYSRSCGVDGS